MTITIRTNVPHIVVAAIREVTSSPSPSVVFTSLATLCVPSFSDGCRVLIEEDGLPGYRIDRPLNGSRELGHEALTLSPGVASRQQVGDHWVQTPFEGIHSANESGFRGIALHLWRTDYQPTQTDAALARLAVDQAVAIVHRERIASAAPN